MHYNPSDSHSYFLYYIHLHIHHMSRIPFLILSFLNFVVSLVRTLVFRKI